MLDVAGAVALARSLLSVTPKDGPPAVRSAARAMHKAATGLQTTWRASAPAKSDDVRPLDTRYDNAWSALRDRLSATASLPEDEHPDAGRAEALLTVLFPTGADFLKLPYAKQWAECDKRIATIAETKAQPRGRRARRLRLLGTDPEAPPAYGDALGITKAAAAQPTAASLMEPLRTAQRAVAAYLLQVAAAAAHDEAFEPIAKRALAPVDDTRIAASRRRAAGKKVAPEPDTTDTPLPAAPTD